MEQKILVTDLHLTPSNIHYKKELIIQVIVIAKERNIKEINILGDIFDSRKAQPLATLKGFEDILELLNEWFDKIIMIPGNHDKVDYESEDSYLNLLAYYPKVELIKNFKCIIEGDNYYHYIPYFKEETKYIEYLTESLIIVEKNKTKKHYLFTHVGIQGVLDNNKDKVENEIQHEYFALYKGVFIGHYHDKSNPYKNIFYIGSLKRNFYLLLTLP